MGSVLKVRGLHTYYGELHALCGVSLHVGEGEIVSVIGNNGAGKTTTLMTVSGVLRPRKGEIEFDGRRIDALKPAEIVALGLGHVPEGRQLFASMTVEENLLMGACSRRAKGARPETLERVYALFPRLQERGRQIAGTLSGGEQQMVAIGRGLMALPRLLMLDEPSLGLSPVMVTAMFEAIRRINQSGTTILLVEQNVFRALTLSNRGYILEDGRIVAEGPSADLLRNPQVRTTYLGL
ncbi:MAG: ABC transporter ATP-binding protein [candidate division NC10 bacterium]|nr:ABC transporter ATP-binding protein [candidate division NC10 bacterium]